MDKTDIVMTDSQLYRIQNAITANNLPIDRRKQIAQSLGNITDPKFKRKAQNLINKIEVSIFAELCFSGEIQEADKYRLNSKYLSARYPTASEWIKSVNARRIIHLKHSSNKSSKKLSRHFSLVK